MALDIPIVSGGNSTNSSGYDTYNVGIHNNNPYRKLADASAKRAADLSSRINEDTAYKTRIYNNPTYREYGVIPNTYNTEEELNKARAKNQSGWEQFGNFLVQAVGSEMALGTLRGFSDIADAALNIFNENNDFTNPLSQALEEAQDKLKQDFEIYRENPNATFDMTDSGWWWDNMVSTATTVSLLMPSLATTKGLSLLGKGLKAAGTIERVNAAGKTVRELNKFGRFSNKVLNNSKDFLSGMTGIARNTQYAKAAEQAAKQGMTALFSRTAENYQEARETYKNYYGQYLDRINNMNDKERNEFIARHPEYADMSNEDIANDIAEQGARETFLQDYWMLGMDFLQFRALSKIWKGNFNIASTTGTRIAERNALAALSGGKKIEDNFINRGKEYFRNVVKNPTQSLLVSELGEGFEEGFQGIQQERGHEVGERILNNYYKTKTLNDYLTDSSIYEQAFWGVVGGIAFGGSANLLGSGLEQYNKYKLEKDYKAGKIDDNTYNKLKMTFENQRIAEINGRKDNLDALLQQMKLINEGKNPIRFKNTTTTDENGNIVKEYEDITSEDEKDMLKAQAINSFITNLTMVAANNGNYDSLKEFINSSELNQYFKENDRQSYINDMAFNTKLSEKMDEVFNVYQSVYAGLVNDVRVDNERALELTSMDITRNKLNLMDLEADIDTLNQQIRANEDNSMITDNFKKVQFYNMIKYDLDNLDERHNDLLQAKNSGVITKEQYDAEIKKLNLIRRGLLNSYKSNNYKFDILNEDVMDETSDVNNFIAEFDKFKRDNPNIFNEAESITNNLTSRQVHRETPNANIQKLINTLIQKESARDQLKSMIPQTKEDYYREYNKQISYIKLNNKLIQQGANDVVRDYIKNNVGYDAAIQNILNENAPQNVLNAIDVIKSVAVDENISLEDVLNSIKEQIVKDDNTRRKQQTQTKTNGVDNVQPPVEEEQTTEGDETVNPSTGGEIRTTPNRADFIGQEITNPVNGKTITPTGISSSFGKDGYTYTDEEGNSQFVPFESMDFAESFAYSVGDSVEFNDGTVGTITMITPNNIIYLDENDEEQIDEVDEFLSKFEYVPGEDETFEVNTPDGVEEQGANNYIDTIGLMPIIQQGMLEGFQKAKNDGIIDNSIREDTLDNRNLLKDIFVTAANNAVAENDATRDINLDENVINETADSFINAIYNTTRTQEEEIVGAPFSATGTVSVNKDNIRNAIRDFIKQYYNDSNRKFKEDEDNKVDIRSIFKYMIDRKVNWATVSLIMNNIKDYQNDIPNVQFMYMKNINSILKNPSKFYHEYMQKVQAREIGIGTIRFNPASHVINNYDAKIKLANKLQRAIKLHVPIKVGYAQYKTSNGRTERELNKDDNITNSIILYSGNTRQDYVEYGVISPVNSNDNGASFYRRKVSKGISFIPEKTTDGYVSNYDALFHNLIKVANNPNITLSELEDDKNGVNIHSYVRGDLLQAYKDLVAILDEIRVDYSNGLTYIKNDDISNINKVNRIINNPIIRAMVEQNSIKTRDNVYYAGTNEIKVDNKSMDITSTAVMMSKIIYYADNVSEVDGFSAEDASIESYHQWIEKIWDNYSQTYELEKKIIEVRNAGKELYANVKTKNSSVPINTADGKDSITRPINSPELRFMEVQPECFYIDVNGTIRTDRGNVYNNEAIASVVGPHNMGFIIGENDGHPLLAMFNVMNPIIGSVLEKEIRNEFKYLIKGYLQNKIGHDEMIAKLSLFVGNISHTRLGENNLPTNPSMLYGLNTLSNMERIGIAKRYDRRRLQDESKADIKEEPIVRLERYKAEDKTRENRAIILPVMDGKGNVRNVRVKNIKDDVLDEIVDNLCKELRFNKTNFAVIDNEMEDDKNNHNYLFKRKGDGKIVLKFSNGKQVAYNNFAHYAVANNIAETTQNVRNGSYVTDDVILNNIYVDVNNIDDYVSVDDIFGKDNSNSQKEIDIDTAQLLSFFGIDPDVIAKLTTYKINGEDTLIPTTLKYINQYYKDSKGYKDETVDASYDVVRNTIKIYKSGKLNMLGSATTAKRLLIHESLHGKIRQDNQFYRRIDEILKVYKYTKEKLDDAINKEKNEYKRQELIDIKEKIIDILDKRYNNNNQKLAEEFLVESLSQGALLNFLNNTEYKDGANTKVQNKTLLQKILEFICDIFGVNRKENSILAKEFEILGNADPVEVHTTVTDESEVNTTGEIANNGTPQVTADVEILVDEDDNVEIIDETPSTVTDEEYNDEEEFDIEDEEDFELESATQTVEEYTNEEYFDNNVELQTETISKDNTINPTGIMQISDMNTFVDMFPYNERANVARMLANDELSYVCK